MNLEFAKNLKKLRREKDMTQDELAQKLSLSVQAISRYETGAAYPDIEMLPVIAGFFHTTVDALLGVSSEGREKRKDEYINRLRDITDRKERLELLRREHAEFPDDWSVVTDMMYEMTFFTEYEYVIEMREIVDDAVKRCDDMLWRENIIFFYLQKEPDDERALEFIFRHSSKYDMTRLPLLKFRYEMRGQTEQAENLSRKKLQSDLAESLTKLTQRAGDRIEEGIENCIRVLDFIDGISQNPHREIPDLWMSEKLQIMLRLANTYFELGQKDEGFAQLETAVRLLENLSALPDGTVLSYGASKFDSLDMKVKKKVYNGIQENRGIVAESIMLDLKYEKPIGPINGSETYGHDMEGFGGKIFFPLHTVRLLENPTAAGVATVRDDARFISLYERAKAAESLENLDNLLFAVNEQAMREDDWIKDKEWICALLVPNVGAYMVFGDADDPQEKLARMKKEGNTAVSKVIAAKVGGGLIPPPATLVAEVIELDSQNSQAQVVLTDGNGGFVFSPLSQWK